MNNKIIIALGFRITWRIMEISEGVAASTDNTLLDLHNSSLSIFLYFTLVMYYSTTLLEPSNNCGLNQLIQIEKDLFFLSFGLKWNPSLKWIALLPLPLFQRFFEQHQGPVPQKMVKFNPGLSLVLRKVFLSKDMQLELKNTVEPLPRDTVMITQKVTLSNT